MIDEAPLLTVKRTFARPAAELVRGFVGLQTAAISDAMGCTGGMDYRIGPLPGLPETFVGSAVTCECGPGDNLAAAAASTLVQAGDVLVAATGGFTGTGVIGDIMIAMLKNRGAAAFVTDGVVRDLADLRRIGLPVFAKGVIPTSVHRSGPGTVGLPVVCGGIAVSAGDILIGDPDGVVVVPQAIAASVLERTRAIRDQERGVVAKVQAGLDAPPAGTEAMAGSRVLFVD
jgi:4-hydroxy-4-methyl-2-oxoglutarate aldolase